MESTVKEKECPRCRGRGKVTCSRCQGSGRGFISVLFPAISHFGICGDCNGTGRVKCVICDGTGKVK